MNARTGEGLSQETLMNSTLSKDEDPEQKLDQFIEKVQTN